MSVKVELRADIKQYEKSLNEATVALQKLSKSVKKDSDKMGKGADDLAKKKQAAYRKMKKESEQFGKAARKHLLLVTAALAAVAIGIGKAIQSAAELETMTTKFEVLTGSVESAKEHVKDLIDFTARTPFQLKGVAAASQVLLAFGFGVDEVKGKLKVLGDVAAASGQDFKRIAVIYGQVEAQGKLQAERLNQLQERGVPILAALAKQYGKTTGEVREMITAGKVSSTVFKRAFDTMNKEGGFAMGGMQKLSETLTGKISTLKDNWEIFMQTIGNRFLPIAKEVTDALISTVQVMSDPIFQAFAGIVLSWVIPIGLAAAAVWAFNAGMLAAIKVAIAAGIAATTAFLPFIAIGAAIVLAIKAVIVIVKKFFSLTQDEGLSTTQAIKRMFTDLWDFLVDGWKFMGRVISAIFSGDMERLKAVLRNQFTDTVKASNDAKAALLKSERELREAASREREEARKELIFELDDKINQIDAYDKIEYAQLKDHEKKKADLKRLMAKEDIIREKQKHAKTFEDRQTFNKELEQNQLDQIETQKAIDKKADQDVAEQFAAKQEELAFKREMELIGIEEQAAAKLELKYLNDEMDIVRQQIKATQDEDVKKKLNKKLLKLEQKRIIKKKKMKQKETFEDQEAFDHFAQMSRSNNAVLSAIGKAAALRNIAIATREAVVKSYNWGGGFPTGLIPAGIALAWGTEQAREVAGLFEGGTVLAQAGGSPYRDSVPAKVAVGETVISKDVTDKVANMADTAPPQITISPILNVQGNIVADDDEQVVKLVDKMNDMVETSNLRLVASTMSK